MYSAFIENNKILFLECSTFSILELKGIRATNRDSAHQFQNRDNFPTFSLGLEFLNEAEKEKNNGKGDSASRFASLSKSEMQQILMERH